MKTLLKHSIFTMGLAFMATNIFGQEIVKVETKFEQVLKKDIAHLGDFQITATEYRLFQLDPELILEQMEGVADRAIPNSGFTAQISLPLPDGSFKRYSAKLNSTMHRDLALSNPGIRSYDANASDGSFVKWDVTLQGFHAMILRPGKASVFIDPVIKGNKQYYIVYSKDHFVTDEQMDCRFELDLESIKGSNSGEAKSFGSCELRTYRLALAATGEYTIFHGGSVANALSAQVTTMNRVNGVYEKDMAITMEIIPNNNVIIFTDPVTDPYQNGNPSLMIFQNQLEIDATIGTPDYDIGHVFGTNSGGLAGLGIVCDNAAKASGVTGSASPIGDPFDIDYVAHEMGHQFGASHTFNNSCGGNRNDPTAFEPGSGSTIMAYAGICPSNVQNNSDDHFHGGSLEQISIEILGSTHQCEQISVLANNAPIITNTTGNIAIPGGTPFVLSASVNDSDGDPVTYNWEQMDAEISTQPPVATSLDGPSFRSWPSSADSSRYFPQLSAVINNGPFTWERLSSESRTMNFRVTVRDNAPGPGACNDHEDITIDIDGNSGPFVVTYPSTSGIWWFGGVNNTVSWDVANTDQAPVSCSTVDILLSIDGGATYPFVLATGTANDGSETIMVPQLNTLTARVMVRNSQATFYDISDNNFQIIEGFAAVDDNDLSSVELYPNPTKEKFMLRWKNEVSNIEVMDGNGRVIEVLSVQGNKEVEIDLSSLAKGIYFLHLTSDQGKSVHTVVKQ